MDIISRVISQRYVLLIILLLLIILGIFLIISGFKTQNQNKLAGWVTIILGVLLIVGTLVTSMFTLFLGVNY